MFPYRDATRGDTCFRELSGVEVIDFERFEASALHRAGRTDGHEDRRLDDTASRSNRSRSRVITFARQQSKLIGGFILISVFEWIRYLAFAALLVAFNNAQGRREEVELFAKTVLQMTLVRKMQPGLPARGEHDKRRRPHGDLS